MKQLVTLSGHSGRREKWTRVHLALCPFSRFIPSKTPAHGIHAAHIQDGSFPLSSSSLKTPSQACLEVCLLGDSQSRQVDLQLPHTHTHAPTYKYAYAEKHTHTYTQRKNLNSIKLVLNDEIKHEGTGDVKAGRKNRQKVTMVAELLHTLEAWRNRN